MTRAFVLASICLILTACGGQDAALIIPKPDINDVRLLRHDLLEIGLRDAAQAGPNFQKNRPSGTRGVEHASRHDIVSADFGDNWSGVEMTIQRESGEKVQLDSASHTITTEPLDSFGQDRRGPLLDYGFSENHKRRSWTLLRTTKTGASITYAEVNWDDHDPTNYLAGGYWMHLDRIDLDWSPAPWAIDDADVGAFIHGPEFAGNPTLQGGVATYRGRTTGLYTFYYGPAWANLGLFKSRETGIYHGVIQLTADFSRNEIEGCVGCLVEGEDTSWRHLDLAGSLLLPGGVRTELYALYHNYKTQFPEDFDLHSYDRETFGREIDIRGSQIQLYFGPTPINRDGSFQGDQVRQELVYFPEGGTTGGTWGGMLSDMNDADGNPRRVIGTMGLHWEHAQGGWSRFIGNFYGTTDPVKQ